MEFIKIERTDKDVDNSQVIAKIPYEVEDEFGNKATLYRKEELNQETLEKEKEKLETQLAKINEKLNAFK